MRVILSEYNEAVPCAWCEREKETVTVDFGDGFIRQAALCWKCLQKAVRVHQRQHSPIATTETQPNSVRRLTERVEPPRG